MDRSESILKELKEVANKMVEDMTPEERIAMHQKMTKRFISDFVEMISKNNCMFSIFPEVKAGVVCDDLIYEVTVTVKDKS